MGMVMTCNRCGHRQLIGYNAVDGRVKWWTRCNKGCGGNFMGLPTREVELLHRAAAALASRELDHTNGDPS